MSYFWYALRTFVGLILRRPILGTCIIPIMPDGQILLVRRRDNGKWGLPGGLIDWGEDVMGSAARELWEETGLELVGLERLVGVYSHPHRDPRFHSICVVVSTFVRGLPRVGDPREILEVRSFPLAALPELDLSHDHNRQIKAYLEGMTVVE